MSKKNSLQKFDSGTILKLELFEMYIKSWLPTFLKSRFKKIIIIDFFAGKGKDEYNQEGSPFKILNTIKYHKENIGNKEIILYFNDIERKNYKQLKDLIERKKEEDYFFQTEQIKINILNCDINKLFQELYEDIKKYPALLFFDQYGLKYLNQNILKQITKTQKTDFMFFHASSQLSRFKNEEALKKGLQINTNDLKGINRNKIHKFVTQHINEKVIQNTQYKCYPFSIKKPSGVYGIIFGTSHLVGVEKYLKIAWNKNKINGEANFDINNEIQDNTINLFDESKTQISKIKYFQNKVLNQIENKKIKSNKELYEFTLENGHITTHLKEIKDAIKEKTGGKNFPLSYKSIYKDNKVIKFI